LDLVFVADFGDGYSVDQMASKNGHFLIRRVLITSLGHDENLHLLNSEFLLVGKGRLSTFFGAKQVENHPADSG
jgi:hypothetical protein